MSETEWLVTKDPWAMLASAINRSERKDRLVLVACCRRLQLRPDTEPILDAAITAAEEYADGLLSTATLKRHKRKVARRNDRPVADLVSPHVLNLVELTTTQLGSICRVGASIMQPVPEALRLGIQNADLPQNLEILLPAILRDIIGNPFHPVTLDSSWLTSTVVALAAGIYEDRAFARLPILADALQDAGCDNEDILDHCRQSGEHVRGCWAVDLLTGRE